MILEPVIGLEIHIQLKTKSKMFCGCPAYDTSVPPNTTICPICTGQPGTLPVPNAEAVRFGVLMGLALSCKIAPHSKFDRKNYFYPDLPKAYQISQYDLPIAVDGDVLLEIPGEEIRREAKIGIVRAHLEEDAAKSFHPPSHKASGDAPRSLGAVGHDASGKTFVDFNRAGTPLLETVTAPDFRSPQEAKAFLQELQQIARTLGISDADMEKGHLRCDANISLRQRMEDGQIVGLAFNPKTEIKNLNSFRHVERALEYEIQRQTKLWESNSPPVTSTTRGWNDTKQVTEEQRSKEEAADYRYFPEPDIPTLKLTELAEELQAKLPELPSAKRARFVEEYLLKPEDARQLCADPALANFTEQIFSELYDWLDSLPELDRSQKEQWTKERQKISKLVSGWTINKLGGLLLERGMAIGATKLTPENFAEFITLLATNHLSTSAGLTVLNAMLDRGIDPSQFIEEQQLGRMQKDSGELADIVDRILKNNPKEVERYKAGKKELLQFFVGLVMKETRGTADAAATKNLLTVKLES